MYFREIVVAFTDMCKHMSVPQFLFVSRLCSLSRSIVEVLLTSSRMVVWLIII